MVVVSTQKERITTHNFMLQEEKFLVEMLFHSSGNHDFWNLQSFLILKHYSNEAMSMRMREASRLLLLNQHKRL